MFRFVVCLVVVHSASAAFFDLTDVEDPLSLLWNTKETFNRDCTIPSNNGFSDSGTCRQKTQCLLAGGKTYSASECGFLSTCCVLPRRCSKSTKATVSYFSNDGSVDFNTTECEYRIEVANNNICQIRIDFEVFQFQGASNISVLQNTATTRRCLGDYLTIIPNHYNIPRQFCGNNDGQHVYVHLYTDKEVRINVHLRRDTITTVSYPRWKIKATQLECPGPVNFFNKYKTSQVEKDFKLLAPEGAIQYYIAPTGNVRSFGKAYGSNQFDEYISGLNYAIAFKKNPFISCVSFTSNYINLRHPPPTGTHACIDYLLVPFLEVTDITTSIAVIENRLCPVSSANLNFTATNVPGPFYMYFVSAETFPNDDSDMLHAFDINYNMISSCA